MHILLHDLPLFNVSFVEFELHPQHETFLVQEYN